MIPFSRPLALFLALLAVAPLVFSTAQAQSAAARLNEQTFIEISRRIFPSVVNITIEPRTEGDEDRSSAINNFFNSRRSPGMAPGSGNVSGSGVVIDRSGSIGYVITNNHVVESVNERNMLKLTFHRSEAGTTDFDQTVVVTGDNARVIGRDELSDLAVIEFAIPEALDDIEPVLFADSDKLEIGEMVLALGNPLNFNHTMTQGIISGKSRYLGSSISIEDLIQTDAVIQPGNSGGPLVNLDGKIVGINNAIISRTGLWQGVSFAIPSNVAKKVVDDLEQTGIVQRGYLGVTMDYVGRFPSLMEAYQLTRAEGVLVSSVVENSPASMAGVTRYDVITDIDGEPVATPDQMLRMITSKAINQEVTIGLIRLAEDRKPLRVEAVAVLGERPHEDLIEDLHDIRRGDADGEDVFVLPEGLLEDEDTPLSTEEIERFGIITEAGAEPGPGVLVAGVTPGSTADRIGLIDGDRIQAVDGMVTPDLRSLEETLRNAERASGLQILILRSGTPVNLKLEEAEDSLAPSRP